MILTKFLDMNFTILHQMICKIFFLSLAFACLSSSDVLGEDPFRKYPFIENYYSFPIPTDPIITVGIPPATSVTIPNNDAYTLRICQNTVVRLNAVSTGVGALTYKWKDISNDFVISSNALFEGVLPEGQYAVFVTDDDGTRRSSATIQVCLVSDPPINVSISTSGATTLCGTNASAMLTLSANASNSTSSIFCPDPVFDYKWFKDGDILSGENASTLTINSATGNEGQYSVVIRNGCGDANPVSIDVEIITASPQDVNVVSSTGSSFICTGESLTLQGSASNEVDTYRWYRNSGSTVGTGASLLVNTDGEYRLEAVNGCGSIFSEPFIVSNLSIPVLPLLISSPGDGIGCSSIGVVMVISNLSSNNSLDIIRWLKDGEQVAEYLFPFPDGTNFQAFETGEYTVILINQCGENTSAPKSVQVTQEPSFAEIIASPFPALAPNCDPPLTSLELSVNTDGTELSYEWFYSDDGVADYTLFSIESTVDITQQGFYRVEIKNTCLAPDDSIPGFIEITEIVDAPIVDITLTTTDPNPNCNGMIVLRTNNGGAGAIYTWRRDGEIVATNNQPNYTAISSGEYQVQISNACGDSNPSNTLVLDINLSPSNVQISPSGDVLVCVTSTTEPVVLQATAQGTNLSYTWLRNGEEVGTGNIFTVNISGEYQVKASNTCGESLSSTKDINFQITPQANDITLVANVCQSPIELLVFTSATEPTFKWYRRTNSNQILLATTTVPSYQVSQNGTYFVNVSNDCLPAGIASQNVEVVVGNTLPLPTIISTPNTGRDRICQGETLTLKAEISNSAGLTYRWFRNNALIIGQQNSTIEVSQSGAYRVEVFLATNATCSRLSLPYSVFVRPSPALLISHQGSLAFCEGDSTILRANATSNPTEYSWYKDDVFVKNGLTLTAKEAGEYRLEAVYNTSTSGYPCVDVITQNITVQTGPRPTPSIIREGGVLTVLEQGFVYQWNLNGIPIINANSPTYLPLDSGRYSITIRNDIGCVGTSDEVFHLGVYLGITDPIQIAPNPNQGSFQVIITSQGQSTFKIFNTMGQVVFDEKDMPKINSISGFGVVRVNHLTPGMYYLKGEIDGRAVIKKIMVQ